MIRFLILSCTTILIVSLLGLNATPIALILNSSIFQMLILIPLMDKIPALKETNKLKKLKDESIINVISETVYYEIVYRYYLIEYLEINWELHRHLVLVSAMIYATSFASEISTTAFLKLLFYCLIGIIQGNLSVTYDVVSPILLRLILSVFIFMFTQTASRNVRKAEDIIEKVSKAETQFHDLVAMMLSRR